MLKNICSFILLLIVYVCGDQNVNLIVSDKLKDNRDNNFKGTTKSIALENSHNVSTLIDSIVITPPPTSSMPEEKISRAEFISYLTRISIEQLQFISDNIQRIYRLTKTESKFFTDAFEDIESEFEMALNYSVKRITKPDKKDDHEFMIELVDTSNFLIAKMLDLRMKKVFVPLRLPTKWYKQTSKEKILRQQTKILTNYIETKVCYDLSICTDKTIYSDYLMIWLRSALYPSPKHLKTLYASFPKMLDAHMYLVKSNMKFKKTIKYLMNSDDVVQRDTFDYLDEIVTQRNNSFNLVPNALKRGTELLIELFDLIDENYDVNDVNKDKLEYITKKLFQWIETDDIEIVNVVDAIIKNLDVNLKIWPLHVQNEIDYIWSEIILL